MSRGPCSYSGFWTLHFRLRPFPLFFSSFSSSLSSAGRPTPIAFHLPFRSSHNNTSTSICLCCLCAFLYIFAVALKSRYEWRSCTYCALLPRGCRFLMTSVPLSGCSFAHFSISLHYHSQISSQLSSTRARMMPTGMCVFVFLCLYEILSFLLGSIALTYCGLILLMAGGVLHSASFPNLMMRASTRPNHLVICFISITC